MKLISPQNQHWRYDYLPGSSSVSLFQGHQALAAEAVLSLRAPCLFLCELGGSPAGRIPPKGLTQSPPPPGSPLPPSCISTHIPALHPAAPRIPHLGVCPESGCGWSICLHAGQAGTTTRGGDALAPVLLSESSGAGLLGGLWLLPTAPGIRQLSVAPVWPCSSCPLCQPWNPLCSPSPRPHATAYNNHVCSKRSVSFCAVLSRQTGPFLWCQPPVARPGLTSAEDSP